MRRKGVSLGVLIDAVNADRAQEEVSTYFSVGSDGLPVFSGSRFDTLGLANGNDPDRVTAGDILAVQMLSVTVPPLVTVDLLEGKLGDDLSGLLRDIPAHVGLGMEDAERHVARNSPAAKAWKALKACDGVGWVTAGKIMARKRSMLIPIYDSVIRCVFRRPTKFWESLAMRLQESDGELRTCLSNLRRSVDLPAEISDIRLLDIVLWMRHRRDHRPSRCAGIGE